MNIGILGTSEIAFRRFLPALKKCRYFTYAGVATRTPEKARPFVDSFGGKIYDGYDALLADDGIEAVYVPLPPALHFEWGKKALEAGRHIMMEKPFAVSLEETRALLKLAQEKNLAVHENYMFAYHSQLDYIQEQITRGIIGDIRLIRIDFGFPFRGAADFRYNKALGGGALLDCGGYTLKLASMLLGGTAEITASQLCGRKGFEVDIYGSATMTNKSGLTAQISFGMDNNYRCSLDIWGSTGSLYTNRIISAPAGFAPTVVIRQGNEEKIITLPEDDTFKKSVDYFERCICDSELRKKKYIEIEKQSDLVEKMIEKGSRQHFSKGG